MKLSLAFTKEGREASEARERARAEARLVAKNWRARARKHLKKKTGMKISGRSILIIPEIQRKRAEKLKKKNDKRK